MGIKNVEASEDEIKDLLNNEKYDQEIESYKENEINWVDENDNYFISWGRIKPHLKRLYKQSGDKFFFPCIK